MTHHCSPELEKHLRTLENKPFVMPRKGLLALPNKILGMSIEVDAVDIVTVDVVRASSRGYGGPASHLLPIPRHRSFPARIDFKTLLKDVISIHSRIYNKFPAIRNKHRSEIRIFSRGG